MCICRCICRCMWYVQVHVQVGVCVRRCMWMGACACIKMCVCVCVSMCMYLCLCICMSLFVHAYVRVHVRVHMSMCICQLNHLPEYEIQCVVLKLYRCGSKWTDHKEWIMKQLNSQFLGAISATILTEDLFIIQNIPVSHRRMTFFTKILASWDESKPSYPCSPHQIVGKWIFIIYS